jgi:Protein of unknown function (DUF3017)
MLEDGPKRRRPQTIGGVVYLVIVAMAVVGLAVILAGAWRTGVSWIGAGLLIGAACRAVLSERGAGMLRVRRRMTDVLMLTAVGVALLVLAVVVPSQPGR